MLFIHDRTIHFRDTDAAGVVYFANVLAICHEAYEASLMASGTDLKQFFSGSTIAYPIVHADINFYQPLYCGDCIQIELLPQQTSESKFEISYQLFRVGDREKTLGRASTQHVCIDPISRKKSPLPAEMMQWLKQWGTTQ
jgi:1,4-dihydroxy-2-naphthoyl-CoA hydrolase